MANFMEFSKYVLLSIVICLIIFYMEWLFKRRKLYEAASSIRGPFSFPVIGAIFEYGWIRDTEETVQMVKKLFEKYGTVVKFWVGPRLIIQCYKPQDMEIIMNSLKSVEKSIFYHHVRPFAPNGIGLAKYELWKKNRRILGRIFSLNPSNNYLDKLSSNTEDLIVMIRNKVHKTKEDEYIELRHAMESNFIALVCEKVFGIPEGLQLTNKIIEISFRVADFVLKNLTKIWTYLDALFSLTKDAVVRKEMIAEYRGITKELVDLTRNSLANEGYKHENDNEKQLLHTLIQNHNLSDDQLHNEVAHILVAGTDSSTSTSNYMLLCLGMFPKIQEMVYKEIIDHVGPHRNIVIGDLSKLEYLERVMSETMRIFPAAQIISRQVTEDLEISNGVVLPAGAMLLLAIFCTHMDPENWPNPWQFNPDRFLPEQMAKRHPYSYLAFSGGIRNCLGYKYAKVNVKVSVATIIRKFKVECGYDNLQAVRHEATIVNRPVLGYKLKFIERN